MNITELASYLHDCGLNVFPVVVEKDKKMPYIPTRDEAYKWRIIKEKRLAKEELLKGVTLALEEGKKTYLGVLPGLITEGKYRDYYFFAMDFDKPENAKILNLTSERCNEKGLWFEKSLSKGYHLYGITIDNVKWDKQHDLGIELFSDSAYFIAIYNNFEQELCELKPGPLRKVYDDWKQELSKVTGIAMQSSKKIDVEKIRQGVVEPGRNVSAFDYARILRDKGLNTEETESIILKWNKKNRPPTSEIELIKTIESVYTKKPKIVLEEEQMNCIGSTARLHDRLETIRNMNFIGVNNDGDDFIEKDTYINTLSKILNIRTLRTQIKTNNPPMYIYADGHFVMGAETYIKELNYQLFPFMMNKNLSDELINRLQAFTYVDDDYFECFDPYLLNVQNGIIDLRTKELFAHNPKYRMTSIIPVKYNMLANYEFFTKFVEEIVNGDDRKVIQEMFGDTLVKRCIFHKAFMLLGEGANGKSVLINCLCALLSDRNVSTKTIKDIAEDKFASAELYHKNANISSETPSKTLTATENFKQLLDNSLIPAQRKHGQPFNFRSYASLIFAANSLPQTFDNSYGFWRRWILVKFPNTFSGANDNKKLTEELTTPERLSGILNYAIDGFARLHQQQQFSYGKTTEEVEKEWKMNSNSVEIFIQMCLEEQEGAEIRTNKMLTEYYAFCSEFELKAREQNPFWVNFNKHIVEIYPTAEKKQYTEDKKYYWKNLRFRQKSESENENVDVVFQDKVEYKV